MFIAGVGTAAPPQRYGQKQCWETLQQSKRFDLLEPRAQALLRKVLNGNNGIATRHLALENLGEAFDLSPDTLHGRFAEHAPVLAAQAGQRALTRAGLQPGEMDAVIISTCTGYLCPGLTSYVCERLGLRADVLSLDLVGQGCGAALPNLRAAEALLAAGRAQRVLSICVEVCSAAMYLDNDPGVLVSACLFGDGAGAAVLTSDHPHTRGLKWKAGGSWLEPGKRDCLRFEQKAGLLRNILRPQVPALAAQFARLVLERILERAQVKREQVSSWVLHPGGRDVLGALRQELSLSESDVRWSEAVLREYGNVSSSSLFFVLETALADSAPKGYWWMTSFGAGFSCHGALLEMEV
ncbi:Chalcone and stilbene synthase domain protein [Verrucomicrobia bacterium]|nr:Chalcone and stilbene synthase domain protein [Verrucomicrobiota bacterium]